MSSLPSPQSPISASSQFALSRLESAKRRKQRVLSLRSSSRTLADGYEGWDDDLDSVEQRGEEEQRQSWADNFDLASVEREKSSEARLPQFVRPTFARPARPASGRARLSKQNSRRSNNDEDEVKADNEKDKGADKDRDKDHNHNDNHDHDNHNDNHNHDHGNHNDNDNHDHDHDNHNHDHDNHNHDHDNSDGSDLADNEGEEPVGAAAGATPAEPPPLEVPAQSRRNLLAPNTSGLSRALSEGGDLPSDLPKPQHQHPQPQPQGPSRRTAGPRRVARGSLPVANSLHGERTPVGVIRSRHMSFMLQRQASADSFTVLSPGTRQGLAQANLGKLGRLWERFLKEKEVDEHADVQMVYKVRRSWVYQQMTLPLACYFIASGHNSYLTGNQFTSKSGTQPIVDALEGGCRVIELDVWSGKNEPKVLHGFTMTKPVSFAKCVRVIRKYAFRSSEFPVIITLENHCNAKNKKAVSEMLRSQFGGLLYHPPSGTKWAKFPSPDELCRKILIRDKDDVDADGGGGGGGEDGVLSPRDSRKWQKLSAADVQGKNVDVVELNELISIVNVKHAIAVDSATAVSSSRGESAFDELLANFAATVVHTRKHLLRTYPGGKRVDSSNYDPLVPWSFGAQIVALNWQTPGVPMWVYRGMFLDNGGCGYIKKPDFLLRGTPTDLRHRSSQQLLSVRLLSARNMRHRTTKLNYVNVELHGIAGDTTVHRSREKRGYDCCTFDQEFAFSVRCPELAVLLLTLYSDDLVSKENFSGQAAIPLNNLNQGRFQMPLMDGHGRRFNGNQRHVALVVDLRLTERGARR